MNESTSSLESELRISHKPVIAILVVIGLVLVFVGDPQPDPTYRSRVLYLAVFRYGASAIAWLLDSWNSWVGRWFTITMLVVMVCLGNSWLAAPGFLTLLVIPTALAGALIGLTAGAVTVVGETALLLALSESAAMGTDTVTIVIALVGVWATSGVMWVAGRRMQWVAEWSREYSERAQCLIEESLDRRVEQQQNLDDLAAANLQLKRLNLLAQGLRQEADDARRAKQQFVANVSHELRTPLNMITGFSEMILQVPDTYGGTIPPPLLADLSVIHRNAEHLADLIDDVLDLSQIDAGQMALTKQHVQFHEMAEVATMAVRPLFDSKSLYLKTEIAEDLPPVFCDRTRIREVLLNLLSNAGRFTDSGGVQLRAWRDGRDIVVSVGDTGRGIAANDMSRLFQPFQQVDGTIRRRYGGTGLGLSISKQFVELHGGRIWVESEEGTGTTVFFRVPLTPPMPTSDDFSRWLDPHWEYAEHTRPATAHNGTVRPRFVLFEMGDSLRRLVTRYWDGVEIVHVTSMERAREELSRVPAQALLINTASVSEALEHLGSSMTLPGGTPAIVCSIPGMQGGSAALGTSDRLVKPVSREALLDALGRLGLEGETILIVDDEPDALQLFGRMLTSSEIGYRPLLARDGREALDILRDCRPDAILLDLIMPNMDGFGFLEMRNRDPALRDIPVIVVSARDPAGQPIVSNALAVTRGGGLSALQLLASIEAISRTLSPAGQVGDPVPTGGLPV